MARVYLAISDNNEILGYFSLSMRCGVVPPDAAISETMKRKLNVQPETNVAQMFLIGLLEDSKLVTVRAVSSGGGLGSVSHSEDLIVFHGERYTVDLLV